MTYCPECGSEVAPENTFCAYCGMALTPVVPPIEDKSEPLPSSPAPVVSSQLKEEEEDWGTFNNVQNKNQFSSEIPVSTDVKPELSVFTPPSSVEAPPVSREKEQSPFESDWAMPEHKSPTGNLSKQNTLDSIPMKTESVDLSGYDFGTPEAEPSKVETATNTEEPPKQEALIYQSPIAEPEVKKVEEPVLDSSWDGSSFSQPQSNPAISNPAISNPIISQPPVSGFKSEEPTVEAPKYEYPVALEEPDFQSTIPYTPKDYAEQSLMAAKATSAPEEVKENKPEQSIAKPSDEPANQYQAPIGKPEMPVGSSSHDSLEPKMVSVQIYDPSEPPKEDDIHDSQTLLKHPVPKISSQPLQQQNPPKEARSYTSPNIGNDDTDGRSKAKLKPLDEGTVLNGRYEVVRKIGGGGMGAVYLASDRNLGGVLRAVKEMVQSYIEDTQQEKAVNDFKRESLLLTSLEHSAIPTIFDYFYDEKEGRFYLVMKYISGGDLAGRMRSAAEGKIDEATVVDWGIQIADVLDYLHNRQPPIIYRDLKPSNVMIDGNTGRVMLIDFGIARWVNKEEKGVTAVGTMGYAPPELFSGNVEPRSDIYSLGSTMFHLLTGADPQSNPLLIFDFHKNPRPRQINSLLSDQVEQILTRMVEYNAEKRFSSAAELRETLTKHLENLRRGAVTHGAGDKSASVGSELVFCGFCGQKIVATDVFCPFCGAQQPLAGQVAKGGQPAYAAPRLTARLMVVSTNDLDAPVFNLEKDTNLVGRRDPMSNIFPEVDLSKFDPQTKISRKHARIWRDNDKFMVEDLGSSNGTVLITKTNEPFRLMKNQPQILSSGDKIRVGDTTLHFVTS